MLLNFESKVFKEDFREKYEDNIQLLHLYFLINLRKLENITHVI